MKKRTAVTLLATILIISAGIFIPGTVGKRYKTIKIGVIASSSEGLETAVPVFQEIIEPDINAYMAKLPKMRFRPQLKFEFLLEHADESAAIHLEKVEMFHEMGVDLIIGGPWSSMAHGSLDYVDENGILLFSPSSTSPMLAIPDDNLFRMCPDDNKQAKAVSEMIWSRGVEEVVVIQRGDVWGDGIYESFKDEYEGRGGTILNRQRYPPDETVFTSYLAAADAAVTGAVNEGVLLISFSEAVDIVLEAQGYTDIYGLTWFGTDGTARSQSLLNEAPDQACHLKIYSTYAAPTYSSKFYEMSERYGYLTGLDLGFYSACQIDIAWAIAMSVLETRPSSSSLYGATDVIEVIPDVASRYFGYSGWCLLNEAGDRYASNYDIWGYGYVDGEPSIIRYGYYDSTTGMVTWLT
jgi:branched-chain amino acid transport system substrate-binding protein